MLKGDEGFGEAVEGQGPSIVCGPEVFEEHWRNGKKWEVFNVRVTARGVLTVFHGEKKIEERTVKGNL